MSIVPARTSAKSLCRAGRSSEAECPIIIAAEDRPPALVRLTLCICLAGLALGIERGESKVEVMLGRFAGIDRAARELADGPVHATGIPLRIRDRSSPGRAAGRAVPLRPDSGAIDKVVRALTRPPAPRK